MKTVSIVNQTRPLASSLKAGYCSSFLCKLKGLTFRSRIAPGEGLLLVQGSDSKIDSSIHMMFVFTDLAVVWIKSDLEVVDVRLAKAWYPGYIPVQPARYVLEMAPSRLADFQVGDRVRFV